MNNFLDHALHDPTADVTIEDFKEHCPPFIVLPDYWKHWALVLKVARAESFKLDFNAEGNLAMNFAPHGTAATTGDKATLFDYLNVTINREQDLDGTDDLPIPTPNSPSAPISPESLVREFDDDVDEVALEAVVVSRPVSVRYHHQDARQ